ncbi:MAG TPA: universal stress protein [Synergistaceae bacterium]|nr:MAG: UspA domain protein [Synergistales bacterium 54_9]HAA47589.1 universal stress protein [Synergistaceae bacterium]HAG22551.1 universal stress protein [Synergistaceae bacterium]
MPRKMLVAVDLSRMGEQVVDYGLNLAARLDVSASFLHVVPHPYLFKGYEPWVPREGIDQEVSQIARKRLLYYIRQSEAKNPELRHVECDIHVLEGNPGDVIIRFAKEHDYNLIVTGYRGHSAIERLVVGSTASTVARYAHCSVLIYRPGSELS